MTISEIKDSKEKIMTIIIMIDMIKNKLDEIIIKEITELINIKKINKIKTLIVIHETEDLMINILTKKIHIIKKTMIKLHKEPNMLAIIINKKINNLHRRIKINA